METSEQQLKLVIGVFGVYRRSDILSASPDRGEHTRLRKAVTDDVVHMIVAVHGLLELSGSH
jgi:hypothetical protein